MAEYGEKKFVVEYDPDGEWGFKPGAEFGATEMRFMLQMQVFAVGTRLSYFYKGKNGARYEVRMRPLLANHRHGKREIKRQDLFNLNKNKWGWFIPWKDMGITPVVIRSYEKARQA